MLDERHGPEGLAPVEREPRTTELRGGIRTGAIEQERRFIRLALPPPELSEIDQRRRGPRRSRPREVVEAALQHLLGLSPPAPPEIDRAVLGPAEREHVPAAVALSELGDPVRIT